MTLAVASTSVFLAAEPSQRLAERIVTWITDFCELSLEDIELGARLHLAAHELVENLVKYGNQSSVRLDVEVERIERASILRLRTCNSAAPEKLNEAVRILTGLRDAKDPVAYYDQLVLESAPREGVSGLGLARICVEGELDVDFHVEGNQLSIVVQTTVHDEEPE